MNGYGGGVDVPISFGNGEPRTPASKLTNLDLNGLPSQSHSHSNSQHGSDAAPKRHPTHTPKANAMDDARWPSSRLSALKLVPSETLIDMLRNAGEEMEAYRKSYEAVLGAVREAGGGRRGQRCWGVGP